MKPALVKISSVIVLSFLLVGIGSYDAQAKNDKAKSPKHSSQSIKRDDDKVWIRIGSDDRVMISRYMRSHYQKNCPPGLAKKNNGCMPPGQAKKYVIGGILPDGIWTDLPYGLLDVLGPAPRGYRYVQVDKDVLLINEATKKILDAVTLLSALD